jgi:hypothetical protein
MTRWETIDAFVSVRKNSVVGDEGDKEDRLGEREVKPGRKCKQTQRKRKWRGERGTNRQRGGEEKREGREEGDYEDQTQEATVRSGETPRIGCKKGILPPSSE